MVAEDGFELLTLLRLQVSAAMHSIGFLSLYWYLFCSNIIYLTLSISSLSIFNGVILNSRLVYLPSALCQTQFLLVHFFPLNGPCFSVSLYALWFCHWKLDIWMFESNNVTEYQILPFPLGFAVVFVCLFIVVIIMGCFCGQNQICWGLFWTWSFP